ncbi:MAG: hypothetical protein HZC45_07865 [Deltaproteobacteria bacterium]|nr:hypothetical protein [Deltaproteobacteria bacterium]
MPKIIAIEKGKNLNPAEAIVIKKENNSNNPVRWWCNYAWETVDLPVEVFKKEYDRFRPFEMNLPDDWEEGYLVVQDDIPMFIYGKANTKNI